MKKPKFLYHGSSIKVDMLLPKQAEDWLAPLGNEIGVYATSNKDIALAFALGARKDKDGNVSRFIFHKNNKSVQMIFALGSPNFGEKGYLYILPNESFEHLSGSQWISSKSVKPSDIIEINVDDYLHLFRYATEGDIKKFEKNIY